MITGFNTNVRYQGRLFHVQTEDSGRKNPHVISHVFYGGTILASQKSEYKDRLDSESLNDEVRELMETQHRALLARLRQGDLNTVIAECLGDTEASLDDSAAEPVAPVTPEPAWVAATPPRAAEATAFGEAVVSAKPLDELILEYLVEKARERGSSRAKADSPPPVRGSRSRE